VKLSEPTGYVVKVGVAGQYGPITTSFACQEIEGALDGMFVLRTKRSDGLLDREVLVDGTKTCWVEQYYYYEDTDPNHHVKF